MDALDEVAAAKPAFRKVNWLKRDIEAERRLDGVVVLRSRVPLEPYETHISAYLGKWANERPDDLWLAQRRGDDRQWRKITFAEGKRTVDRLTQGLLDLGLTADRPVAILSGNSLEHALMTQAAMQARAPAAPISPAYSLLSRDHAKLRDIFARIRPGLVLVQDGVAFEKALLALHCADDVTVVCVDRPPSSISTVAFADLAATPVTADVGASIAAITGDTIGKLLFTSGSTGAPKAVINTQRMMCANVMMSRQARPRGPDDPTPVLLDWMPWSHTMAGNAIFNGALANGSELYIDDGRPQPGLFDETLRNLREISPTYYSNVPAAYAMLAAALERDDALRDNFFKDLQLMGYGGARLPDDVYERMQALAVRATGQRIVFSSGWGATETAPTATSTYWDVERSGLIGLPLPGVELKLAPVGGKYEVRLRGVSVMPGYYGQPELTRAAFDDEGFYKIGDAATFVDDNDPSQGLIFAGRVVEDFKLTTGTFVQVGSLRVATIAAATPVVQDALVTGQDRPFIGLLAWPALDACRQLIGDMQATLDDVVRHPKIRERLREGLRAYNREVRQSSSFRVARAMLMTEPPSIDSGEITDKGYANQHAGLERRATLVARLYADAPDASVIVID